MASKGKKKKPHLIDYLAQNYAGKSCRKGHSLIYQEKKRQKNISLTPTAIDILERKSNELKLPASEFIERWLRSLEDKEM